MYHRFEVTTRERKTSQIILIEDHIMRAKQRFNTMFDDFMKRKTAVLARYICVCVCVYIYAYINTYIHVLVYRENQQFWPNKDSILCLMTS